MSNTLKSLFGQNKKSFFFFVVSNRFCGSFMFSLKSILKIKRIRTRLDANKIILNRHIATGFFDLCFLDC